MEKRVHAATAVFRRRGFIDFEVLNAAFHETSGREGGSPAFRNTKHRKRFRKRLTRRARAEMIIS